MLPRLPGKKLEACKGLRAKRIQDIIPRKGIVLPPKLTGYHTDVLFLRVIWDYEYVLDHPMARSKKEAIVTAIKYFFKKERLAGCDQTGMENLNMVSDGLFLYSIRYKGACLADPVTEPRRKFALVFTG